MYLTRVELNGFKSFADKTSFTFDEGITAILGPNGCGKSNVVDAIKWVLGESSAKNLRGTAMADVIFAGSERRKPLGMAEVNLYFDNRDGRLAVDYNEVCISRRLYRSGESEYLINRQPCRKRDIRDMLLDTGVGTSAYSVIEQGKVEALLHAKPAERRAVFEEAAGIAKYKQRRKETLARVDRTNQYLLRVNDIVEEIERSMRRVGRQAASARRWQRLKAELDLARTHNYARRYRRLTTELEQFQREHGSLEELLQQESAGQGRLAEELAQLTQRETTLELELERREVAALNLQERLGDLQAELSATTERIRSRERESQDAAGRIGLLEERLAQLVAEQEQTASDVESARGRLAEVSARLQEVEAERDRRAGVVREAESGIERLRREMLELTESRSRLSTEAGRVQAERQGLLERSETVEERRRRFDEEESALAAQVAELTSVVEAAGAAVMEVNSQIQAAREDERRQRAEVERLNDRLAQLKAQQSSIEGKLATLDDLEKSLAGANQGVKTIMTAARDGEAAASEVEGLVADLLTVPQDVALAIETTVGGQAQDVVVRTSRGAQQCIEYLKRQQAGRATFLPLDSIRSRNRLRNVPYRQGVLGEAVDLVQFDEKYRAAVEYVLAGVLIVESLDLARQLARDEARGVRIVTLDGDVINPYGAMTGGHDNKRRGGLITRKAEMDALREQLNGMDAELQKAADYRDRAIAGVRAAGERAGALEADLAQQVRAGQEQERALSVRRSELERVQRDRRELDTESGSLQERLNALAGREEICRNELSDVTERIAVAEVELAGSLDGQRETRSALDELAETLAGLREQRAAAQSRVDDSLRQVERLASDQRERSAELERARSMVSGAGDEIEGLRQRREELVEQERLLLSERDGARDSGTGLRQQIQAVREALHGLRDQEKAFQRRTAEVHEAMNGLKIRENETGLKLEALKEKAREDLQVEDLAAVAADVQRQEEETRARAAELGEDAAAEAFQDEDDEEDPEAPIRSSLADGGRVPLMTDEQLRILIDDLQVKIQKIGPVNMCAIDELTELEARHAFLAGEQDDLRKAAEDLLAVIDRLNEECSRRFEETFEAVRVNFQDMFRRLFGGGKADLVLEKPEGPDADALDAGIDVIARPPGKEPKSISLLSGGEKALCAVALLFAIFRSKPSPFCILDEVDGPLDESNIDRFMSAVRDFSKETQFILISHSKRTMSMTDIIYGVTQEEPGVSTKRSLKFAQMHDEVVDAENRSALDDRPLPRTTAPESEAESVAEEELVAAMG